MESIKEVTDLNVYVSAKELGNSCWKIVNSWDHFKKNTLGYQITRAADSVSANIAEGFGRYHKKDKIKFYLNARASVYEVQDWSRKALDRKMIDAGVYRELSKLLRVLPKQINQLIKVTNQNLKK